MNSGEVSQAIDFENFKIDRIESLSRAGDQERSAASRVERTIWLRDDLCVEKISG